MAAQSAGDLRNPGSLPPNDPPAYTTVQTTVYRLETKKALRRTRKIGNAHLFEPVLLRSVGFGKLVDDFLGLFGGRRQPVVAHLIESGNLTFEDVQEAEKTLGPLAKKGKSY